jgi:hypothetical protein
MKGDKMKQILFNTEMVKVILNGNKTQTRRPVKKDLIINLETDKNDPDYLYVQDKYGDSHHLLECAPYYKNQILYVRETFADIPETAPGNIRYKASATEADLKWFEEKGWNWRPSIHMPKKLARIFLKVINVRIERLQDITPMDAAAEGVDSVLLEPDHPLAEKVYKLYGEWDEKTQDMYVGNVNVFATMWNEIYEDRDYGWEENPYVWVVEFKVLQNEKM